jgi:tellurite methyltransferase
MTNNDHEAKTRWQQFLKATADRPAREFLVNNLKRFQAPGSAIDLGCGAGGASLYLLEQGWQVLAVDGQEAAIQALLSKVPAELAARLSTLVLPFEELSIPSADLIWAGRSLPFCHPDEFDRLWGKIGAALMSGGRFVGDFFGPRHAWADRGEMTFLSKEQVISLCLDLELEYLVEEEGEAQTVLDGMQHWHQFTVCARKP